MNKIVNGVASEYEIPNVESLLINNERKQITDIYNEENHSVIATKLYSLEKQIEEKDKEIERLNNIINKAIHYINLNQDEKTLCLNYNQLKALRGILKQDDFYLKIFEEQLKELKEGR